MDKNYHHLQKYLQWSDAIMSQVEEYIQGTLGGEPYIAVHLRIGTDWVRKNTSSCKDTLVLVFLLCLLLASEQSIHPLPFLLLPLYLPPSPLVQARACKHAVGTDSFMASQQCLEYHEGATITQELCLPSHNQIAADIKAVADATGIQNIFLGSDSDPKMSTLQEKIGSNVSFFACASRSLGHFAHV